MKKLCLCGVALAALAASIASPVRADESLRVGKADRAATPIIPVDVGVKAGIFAKHGLTLQVSNFGGGGKLHQGMAAGAIDIGVGSGPELALIAKGSPEIAICEEFPSARFLGVALPADSTVRSVTELRGKKIGVSSNGSLTYWLALQMSRKYGWGPNGVETVAIGNGSASIISAFRTHAVDADVSATSVLFDMEANKVGRLLIPVSDYMGNLAGGTIYATKALIASRPETIRRFLAAWFDTVDFMRTHRTEAVKIMSEVTGFAPEVEGKEYDLVMPMMFTDGHFPPARLKTIEDSMLEMGLLTEKPDMSKLYTEAFLPQ